MKENPHEHSNISPHTMEGYLFVQEKREKLSLTPTLFSCFFFSFAFSPELHNILLRVVLDFRTEVKEKGSIFVVILFSSTTWPSFSTVIDFFSFFCMFFLSTPATLLGSFVSTWVKYYCTYHREPKRVTMVLFDQKSGGKTVSSLSLAFLYDSIALIRNLSRVWDTF